MQVYRRNFFLSRAFWWFQSDSFLIVLLCERSLKLQLYFTEWMIIGISQWIYFRKYDSNFSKHCTSWMRRLFTMLYFLKTAVRQIFGSFLAREIWKPSKFKFLWKIGRLWVVQLLMESSPLPLFQASFTILPCALPYF